METELDPPARRPQFKIIHLMIASMVFALIFAILNMKTQEFAALLFALLII